MNESITQALYSELYLEYKRKKALGRPSNALSRLEDILTAVEGYGTLIERAEVENRTDLVDMYRKKLEEVLERAKKEFNLP